MRQNRYHLKLWKCDFPHLWIETDFDYLDSQKTIKTLSFGPNFAYLEAIDENDKVVATFSTCEQCYHYEITPLEGAKE